MQVIEVDYCPCCASKDYICLINRTEKRLARFRKLSDHKYGGHMSGWESHLSLEVFRCTDCGHLWHAMQPNQTALFGMYGAGRRLKGGVAKHTPAPHMIRSMRDFYRLITSITSEKPTLLDYGSGAGRWAQAARSAGFAVTAYEPTASRISSSEGVTTVSDLSSLQKTKFHAINLEQVLEHIPAPITLLKTLTQWAGDTTVIRVSVPDVNRYSSGLIDEFPFNGKTVHILSPYEHLHGFCRTSFNKMITRADMVEIDLNMLWRPCPQHALRRIASRLGAPWSQTSCFAQFLPQ